MDDSIYRNLDSQHRLLADLERSIDAELADEPDAPVPYVPFSREMAYDQITAANDDVRVRRGWEDVDLSAALTTAERESYGRWLARQRLPWAQEDVVTLGFAGLVGVAATMFDTQLDGAVKKALGSLKGTGLLKRWEKDAARLPIDYTGPGFGGPAHRIRSAGHDLGRPLEALRQIREGVFRGTSFPHGVRNPVEERLGNWRNVTSWSEAMVLWMKHMAADVVTPMSLPLPGFSVLAQMDNTTVRDFARAAYQGQPPLGNGLNVRSGMMTPTLAVLSTEAILRCHMVTRAYRARGSVELTAPERSLQTELLLAGHGLVGAFALGKAAAVFLATAQPYLAVTHVNVPVLMRAGSLGVAALGDSRERAKGAPSWDDILLQWAQPWQLEAAIDVEHEAQRLIGDPIYKINPT